MEATPCVTAPRGGGRRSAYERNTEHQIRIPDLLAAVKRAIDRKRVPGRFLLTGSANLLLHARSSQLRAHIDDLKRRNCFLDVGCKDRQDAEETVAFVRKQSKPLE
jgi:hypothetical protein